MVGKFRKNYKYSKMFELEIYFQSLQQNMIFNCQAILSIDLVPANIFRKKPVF